MTARPALIPPGSWPARMCAELAEGRQPDPTIMALVDALARDMARDDHEREQAMPSRQEPASVT